MENYVNYVKKKPTNLMKTSTNKKDNRGSVFIDEYFKVKNIHRHTVGEPKKLISNYNSIINKGD